MTETRSILKAVSTVDSKLSNLPIEDGQLIFVYDKKKIILDNHGVRTVYEQIQTIETEEQRNDLLAPIDSFYFVIETSILWRYSNGHWNQITTSPQEQIDRIVAEGTKQVKAVRDEGQKVLQSIPEDFQTQMETKLNKQQGIENKGKVLVIGEDGNVVPGEVQSGGGDGIAIINTMSGESPLAIPDSAERVNKRLELGGKTEQVQTTGAQLFDKNSVVNGVIIADGSVTDNAPLYVTSDYIPVKPSVMYACTETGSKRLKFFDIDKQPVQKINFEDANVERGSTFTTGETTRFIRLSLLREKLDSIMLNEGSKSISYEPYTGGKPSPSQEYQQEIKNVGKWNEETQKYEVGIKIIGSNQFNVDAIKTVLTTNNYNGYELHLAPGRYTLSTENKMGNTGSGEYLYMQIKRTDGSFLASIYVIANEVKKAVNINVNKDEIIYFYDALNRGESKQELSKSIFKKYNFMLTSGDTQTPYEPYKEQVLTLTSDRPITKWDKLVEQGGQYGWLYKHKIIEDFSTLVKDTEPIYGNDGGKYFSVSLQNASLNYDRSKIYSEVGVYGKDNKIHYIPQPMMANVIIHVSDTDTIMTAKEHMHYKVIYETIESQFVHLPQSEQNAIRALKTYYPTTVITVDGGEVDPDIKVTYTADTKNYIDNKFGKTINAMQTKLLELESRV